jgi:hypothetical protein
VWLLLLAAVRAAIPIAAWQVVVVVVVRLARLVAGSLLLIMLVVAVVLHSLKGGAAGSALQTWLVSAGARAKAPHRTCADSCRQQGTHQDVNIGQLQQSDLSQAVDTAWSPNENNLSHTADRC